MNLRNPILVQCQVVMEVSYPLWEKDKAINTNTLKNLPSCCTRNYLCSPGFCKKNLRMKEASGCNFIGSYLIPSTLSQTSPEFLGQITLKRTLWKQVSTEGTSWPESAFGFKQPHPHFFPSQILPLWWGLLPTPGNVSGGVWRLCFSFSLHFVDHICKLSGRKC